MNATIENQQLPSDAGPVSSARPQRFDLYGPIHKTIRVAMSDVLVRMGKTNFANESAAARITEDLQKLLALCDQHIQHEVNFVHPHLAERLPNALAKIDDGHAEHDRFVAELRALSAGVVSAPTRELRALAGTTLYLHYSAFFADTLAHMVEEERVLQPLIHRFFTDQELLGIQGAILASIPPAENFEMVCTMLPAVNGPERADILGGVHAGAPPEAFQALVAALRSRLDADEWTELLGLCPFLG